MNIVKYWNGQIIRIRQDRYVSLTDMAQACGKKVNGWLRQSCIKSYLNTLSSVTEIPVERLIEVKQGGIPELQGTWGDFRIAVRFAQWCSDEFALQVDFWIEELLTKGGVDINLDGTAKYANTQGFVYLATAGQMGWCKIGASREPYRRMTSLQTGSPLEIVLIHRIFTFNCKALEKALHEHYSAYWMRGEWFELPQECIDEFPMVANQLDTALEQACLPTG